MNYSAGLKRPINTSSPSLRFIRVMDPESNDKSDSYQTNSDTSGQDKNYSRHKRTVVDVPPRDNVGPDGLEVQEFK